MFSIFFSHSLFADSTPGDAHTLEYKVKAAYLYNFTKFIKWPTHAFSSETNSTLNICILGEDPFGSTINLLKNKTAKGHEVSVVYLEELTADSNCHVLFVSRSLKNNVKEILEKVASKNILTVSDIDGFAMKRRLYSSACDEWQG